MAQAFNHEPSVTHHTLKNDLHSAKEHLHAVKEKVASHKTETLFAIGGISLAAIGLNAGFNGLSNNNDSSERFGEKDDSITSINIQEGANIRYDPYVADIERTNIVDTYSPNNTEEVTIQTPDGVYISKDANGTWYGVDPSSVPQLNGDRDTDGIVWINEQKASPEIRE